MIPIETSYFNFVDCCIIGICLLFVIFGYLRGLTKEFLSICSWGLAFIISFFGVHYVSSLFDDLIKLAIVRYAVAFILLFVVTLTFFLLLASILSDKVAQTRFCDANKALGGIFGIVKGFVIALCITIGIIVFTPQGHVMQSINSSKIGPYVKDIAIECCVSLKDYLKSDEFRNICKYFDKELPPIQASDSAEEMKKLAIPQVSKIVYNREDNAAKMNKKEDVKEAEYNKRRDKYIRRQAAIGQKKKDDKTQHNKITAETLNRLVNG